MTRQAVHHAGNPQESRFQRFRETPYHSNLGHGAWILSSPVWKFTRDSLTYSHMDLNQMVMGALSWTALRISTAHKGRIRVYHGLQVAECARVYVVCEVVLIHDAWLEDCSAHKGRIRVYHDGKGCYELHFGAGGAHKSRISV